MIQRPIRRVLVACRGEQAAALVSVLEAAGIETVAPFDADDSEAPYLDVAAWPVPLPPSAASAPQGMDPAALIGLALDAGADAIHPGTGPLRWSAEAARMVMNVGLAWIGARPDALAAYEDAHQVRGRAVAAGLVPGFAGSAAPDVRRVRVMVLGDGQGDGLVLGEHAVLSETVRETPAPGLDDVTRARLWETALRFVRAERIVGSAVVDFTVDARGGVGFEGAHLGLGEGWGLHDEAWGIPLVLAEVRLHSGESLGVSRAEVRLPDPSVEIELRALADAEAGQVRIGGAADGPVRHGSVEGSAAPAVRHDDGLYVTCALYEGARVRAGSVIARLRAGGPTHGAARVRACVAVKAASVEGVPSDAASVLEVLSDPVRWPA
jgi:acetyl/propionyl-CoA carboxylase alpha subunit